MKAIDSSFRKVNRNQRRSLLAPKSKIEQGDSFFHEYRACVFSNRNAPGADELRGSISLSLEEVREAGQGAAQHKSLTRSARGCASRRAGHVPAKCLVRSPEGAAAGICSTAVIICHLNGAAARRPQNRGYSRPLLRPQRC